MAKIFRQSRRSTHLVDFYQDIDKMKIKSSCSLGAILALLFAVFLIGLGGIFLLTNEKTNSFLDSKPAEDSSEGRAVESVIINADGGQGQTIRLSESDLESIMGVQDESFPLKKSELSITSSYLVLTGNTKSGFLSPRVSIYFVPEVAEGKINPKITKIEIGKVSVPPKLGDEIDSSLTKFWEGRKIVSEEIRVKEVSLSEGYVNIVLGE